MFVIFKTTSSASSINISLNKNDVSPQPCSKYLGVYVDSKLSFITHIINVKSTLGRHCGVDTNVRSFVPFEILIK